jgi:hypothetical protein
MQMVHAQMLNYPVEVSKFISFLVPAQLVSNLEISILHASVNAIAVSADTLHVMIKLDQL